MRPTPDPRSRAVLTCPRCGELFFLAESQKGGNIWTAECADCIREDKMDSMPGVAAREQSSPDEAAERG